MKFYLAGRGAGKTFQCVEYLKANPEAVLVVPDQMRAKYIADLYGVSLKRIRTVNQLDMIRGLANTTLVIDGLESMLHKFFGNSPIAIVTLDGENEMTDYITPANLSMAEVVDGVRPPFKCAIPGCETHNPVGEPFTAFAGVPEHLQPTGGTRAERPSDAPLPPPPTRANREGDSQSLPVVQEGVADIQSAVIADINTRREVGIERYGTALQAGNGRDALLDAYEEALDLCMYLKQAMVERDAAEHMTQQQAERNRLEIEAASQGFRLVAKPPDPRPPSPQKTEVGSTGVGSTLPPAELKDWTL